jgi:hypothetical protein
MSGFTAEQLDQLYDRLVTIASLCVRRSAIMVINPAQQSFMQDMVDRMAEDTEYKLTVGQLPNIMVHDKAQEGEIKFSVPGNEGKLLTIQQLVNSASGYGRYGKILLPQKGEDMRPWGKF